MTFPGFPVVSAGLLPPGFRRFIQRRQCSGSGSRLGASIPGGLEKALGLSDSRFRFAGRGACSGYLRIGPQHTEGRRSLSNSGTAGTQHFALRYAARSPQDTAPAGRNQTFFPFPSPTACSRTSSPTEIHQAREVPAILGKAACTRLQKIDWKTVFHRRDALPAVSRAVRMHPPRRLKPVGQDGLPKRSGLSCSAPLPQRQTGEKCPGRGCH